jgi:hypothetical protein
LWPLDAGPVVLHGLDRPSVRRVAEEPIDYGYAPEVSPTAQVSPPRTGEGEGGHPERAGEADREAPLTPRPLHGASIGYADVPRPCAGEEETADRPEAAAVAELAPEVTSAPIAAPETAEVSSGPVAAPETGVAPPAPLAAPRAGEVASDVAARLLAEILALDLGNLTPIRALTLLHDLQTKAREAVPWRSWMASMAGARDQVEHQQR